MDYNYDEDCNDDFDGDYDNSDLYTIQCIAHAGEDDEDDDDDTGYDDDDEYADSDLYSTPRLAIHRVSSCATLVLSALIVTFVIFNPNTS